MTVAEVIAVAKAIFAHRHDATRVEEAFMHAAEDKLSGDVRLVRQCIETAKVAIQALDAHRGVSQ